QVFRNLYQYNHQYILRLSFSLDLEVSILSKILRGYGLSKSELRKLRVFLYKKKGMSLTDQETAEGALEVFLNLVRIQDSLIRKNKNQQGEIVCEKRENSSISPILHTALQKDFKIALDNYFFSPIEDNLDSVQQEIQLTTVFKDLIIEVGRFQDRYKDASRMSVDLFYDLPGSYFGQKKAQRYELESFIYHKGRPVKNKKDLEYADFGHYIAYVKIQGLWYCCNDAQVTQISSDEALQVAQQASVYHLRKIPA
nr:ubiquitin carboxyl-terminal hydrolase family protein [Chlamydiales bacterium]